MNFTVLIDWKFVVALGGASGIIILVSRMDPDASERVLTHAVEACKEYATTVKVGC